MSEKITAVFGSSKTYYDYAPMVVGSLLRQHPDAKVYFFADDDEVPGMKHPNVEILNINNFPSMVPSDSPNITQRFSKFTLLKCWLPEWLPQENKVIWLDMDTLVLDTIQPIWDLDMSNTLLYGALDVLTLVERAAERGTTNLPIYINTGVCIMNLALMRAMQITSKLIKALSETRFKYVDQDALNDTCFPHIRTFSHAYNYGGTWPGYNFSELTPHIRHFVAEGGWSKRFLFEYFPMFKNLYTPSLETLCNNTETKKKE